MIDFPAPRREVPPTARERALERAYLEMIGRITREHVRVVRRLKRQLMILKPRDGGKSTMVLKSKKVRRR